MKTTLWLHQKKFFENGAILEMKLWQIEKSKNYPEGIKYSLIFINPALNRKL